jgi:bacteriorhodopsin
MAILIPCSTAIGILGIITLYQIYLNHTFTGSYKDKLYYFNAHLITLTTISIYTLMILNELFIGEIDTIHYFYIEWLCNTPLILIDLGKLTNIKLDHYIYVILLDQLMIISGYVSYITANQTLSFIMFGLGSLCYTILFTIYVKNLKIFSNDVNQARLRSRICYVIYSTMAIIWTLYPVTEILFKTAIIDFTTTSAIFIVLDVLTKGVFTTLMLGSKEIYQTRNSQLKNIMFKLFKVHPLEINTVQPTIDNFTEVIVTSANTHVVSENRISPKSTTSLSTVHSVHSINDNKDLMDLFNNFRRKSLKINNVNLHSIEEGSREISNDSSPYAS